ncbi:hypothetical protein DUNSADRAFT_1174 [Dunaliella salina]|uniref:EF-hand domain-containing protein n=1 Tax=Dunaliella salina TaxID=3046 RepID=A0ABQ7GXG8_DUNSA|nr:hypothetical protein DUNSADRAFT_1174 [Dunaliella salina]|eukprot:KAF5839301.1 hypothetical protein DUNSADRAFT_1174 [Dunaliella salina]
MAGGEERQATPQHDQLQALTRLCSDLDKKSSGCIPRLALEGFLHREVRPLLAQIDGATMLDLLETCTFDGKSSKLILFKPFLANLRQALKDSQGQQPKALRDMLPHQQHHNLAGPTPGMPAAPVRPPALDLPPSPMLGHPNQQPLISALPPDPNQYLHYEQVRGPQGKRAVTPKVGEEPLNYREFQAVRASSPYRSSRASTPQAPEGIAQPSVPSPHLTPPYHVDHFPPPSAGFAPPSSRPIPHPSSAHRNGAPSHHQALPHSHPFALPQQQHHQQQQQQQQEQQQHHHKLYPMSPYKPNPGYSLAPNLPAPVTPVRQSTPPRQIQRPSPEILDCMHDPVPGVPPPKPPTPRQSFSPPSHISQYDIINAEPHVRARLKAELKQQLQEDWKRQIQEKSEMEASVLGAEHSWPYTPVRDPNDKRPLSAISRPLSPRGAHTRSPAWHI